MLWNIKGEKILEGVKSPSLGQQGQFTYTGSNSVTRFICAEVLNSLKMRNTLEQLNPCFISLFSPNKTFPFSLPISKQNILPRTLVVFICSSPSPEENQPSSQPDPILAWAKVAPLCVGVNRCLTQKLESLSLEIDLPLPVGLWFRIPSLSSFHIHPNKSAEGAPQATGQ